ncbi:unnamed protein product [Coccothraustes coccothraustes]
MASPPAPGPRCHLLGEGRRRFRRPGAAATPGPARRHSAPPRAEGEGLRGSAILCPPPAALLAHGHRRCPLSTAGLSQRCVRWCRGPRPGEERRAASWAELCQTWIALARGRESHGQKLDRLSKRKRVSALQRSEI